MHVASSESPDRRYVLSKWRVPDGARVVVGQVICEIESDAATTEVEAFENGTLVHLMPEWGSFSPGEKIADIVPVTS